MNAHFSENFKLCISKTSNQELAYMYDKYMHKNNKTSNFRELTVSAE